MCGICGILEQSGRKVDEALVDRMMSSLHLRGPDGSGKYIKDPVGLGHRRLSIIDVSGGGQPISNEDGSLHLVFNGEIYNFIELRKELESYGHCFATKSDTEVIVHGYEQWGCDCVRRFNGMFAFALWDSEKGTLFLARDHLGIKPLYYMEIGTKFIFASEIKALLQDPECERSVDCHSLIELFSFRYVPSPKSIFKNIFKIPPGHLMTVSRDGVKKICRYWDWIPQIRKNANQSSLIEEYQHLLSNAVRLQLRSDVPLGLFLSSGIDSAVILALMREHSVGTIQTFTIGFQGGERTNEIDDAREIATRYDASHEAMLVSPQDYIDYYQRYMWDLEEPVGNETAAAFHFVSSITSRHVKVALSGQGADEPWAGYHRHLGAKYASLYNSLPKVLRNKIIPSLVALLPRNERIKRGVASLNNPDDLKRLTNIYSFFSSEMKDRLFLQSLKSEVPEYESKNRQALAKLYKDVSHLDPLTQILYIDTRANLPDDLLMVGDKTSMANSLEVRVPFLDVRLVEFIETLPPHFKLNGLQAKHMHKKALEKWLPKSEIYRRKKGFENPIYKWMKTGAFGNLVKDMLLQSDSSVNIYFDSKYIKEIIQKHQNGREAYMRQIYLLLSFELWHRMFIRQRPSILNSR